MRSFPLEAIEESAPNSASPASEPPPLPDNARQLSQVRAAEAAAFADIVIERLAAGDYAGVLMAAEMLLVHHPRHADALAAAQMSRSELRKLYIARLGSLDRVARVAIGAEGLLALSLDFRAGILLSCVDGLASLGEIVEDCGLSQLDALRVLSELFLRNAIVLDG
jgi:hypothetical protein